MSPAINSAADGGSAIEDVPANPDVQDLIIIGGGVMGLFTAYYASLHHDRVTVLESNWIGDPMTASFGKTRSYRRDYLDATYVRFADEATRLWARFEAAIGKQVLVKAGCMNIASATITPDLAATYSQLSYDTVTRLGLPMEQYGPDEINAKYPYLTADLAHLDTDAGLVDLASVTSGLLQALNDRGVTIREHTTTTAITEFDGGIVVQTAAGELRTKALVITAGHGTNDVLSLFTQLRIPLSRDRPSEAKYFQPPAETRHQFTSDVMPVIAYLDTGVYCHPIVEGVIDAVKIGYYNPPDIQKGTTSIGNIADFVDQVMPGLKGAEFTDVTETDGCDYDLVGDDDFVLGPIPGIANVFVGVGWRGTGYKFSPWVGRVLAELALQDGTIYDISRFTPSRFSGQL